MFREDDSPSIKLWPYFGRGYYHVYNHLLPPELTRIEVDFLIRELRPQVGERWLDMPCGYGRHLASLAEARRDLKMVGGDLSREYLCDARRRLAASVAACDMRLLPFANGAFHVVLNLLNSFGYYPVSSPWDDHAVLSEFARVLKPGGRLVLDLSSRRALIALARRPAFRSGTGEYESLERFDWDPKSEVLSNQTEWRWPGGFERARYRMRLYTPEQIGEMLKFNGLEVENIFGDFDGRPFDPCNSDRTLIIAKK